MQAYFLRKSASLFDSNSFEIFFIFLPKNLKFLVSFILSDVYLKKISAIDFRISSLLLNS